MLEIEDVLTSLTTNGKWLETGFSDKSTPKFRKFTGVVRELELQLDTIHQREAASGVARLEVNSRTATGNTTRGKSKAGDGLSVVSHALRGMPRIELAAVYWIVANDLEAYDRMHRRLLKFARQEFGRSSAWPGSLRRKSGPCERSPAEDYVPDLVTLALMEMHTPSSFHTNAKRASWFGLSESHWRASVRNAYAMIQARSLGWFDGACSHIAGRLARFYG